MLEQAELAKSLPQTAFHVKTTETNLEMIREVACKVFGGALANRQKITYRLAEPENDQWKDEQKLYDQLGVPCDPKGLTLITPKLLNEAKARAKRIPGIGELHQ